MQGRKKSGAATSDVTSTRHIGDINAASSLSAAV